MSLVFIGLLSYLNLCLGIENLEEILKLKCDGLPQRSIFDKMTCFVVESTSRSCNDIQLPYAKLVKASSNKLQRKHGFNDLSNSQICAFRIRDGCDNGDVVGDKCTYVSLKTASFLTAAKVCEEKGYNLFVPHNDKDLQQLFGITSSSPDEYFWIGAATMDKKWRFYDKSSVDFFRFKPHQDYSQKEEDEEEKEEIETGLLFQGKKRNDSYVGYTVVQGIENKFSFVCSKVILKEYRVISKTVNYERRTTLGEATTTQTTASITEKRTTTEEIIPRGSKINVIRRFLNALKWNHHYYLDDNLGTWGGSLGPMRDTGSPQQERNRFVVEENVGFVITASWINRVNCDKKHLIRMARWQRIISGAHPVSLFAPADEPLNRNEWEQMETFLCVTKRGHCNANWQLILYPRKPNDSKESALDLFYPSNEVQKGIMDRGLLDWSKWGEHICYIWKQQNDIPYIRS